MTKTNSYLYDSFNELRRKHFSSCTGQDEYPPTEFRGVPLLFASFMRRRKYRKVLRLDFWRLGFVKKPQLAAWFPSGMLPPNLPWTNPEDSNDPYT
jgi:hypothetical protein